MCDPELDESNNCFVIDGSLTVKIEEEDSIEETMSNVKEVIKEVMNGDELLDENTDVKKVKYIEYDNDNDGDLIPSQKPERAQSETPIPLIIGASLLTLSALIAIYLYKRRRLIAIKTADALNDDDGPSYIEDIFSEPDSYEEPDGNDLGKNATIMDVHECKSSTCPKCYDNPSVTFISAPQLNIQRTSEDDLFILEESSDSDLEMLIREESCNTDDSSSSSAIG